jgi:nitrogen fixation-related uncharacterized protein
MEVLMTIIVAVFIAMLGVAAEAWGVDSRPTINDNTH